MPFPFLYVCDLLEELQEIRTRDPPVLPKEAKKAIKKVIERWFINHRRKIDHETDGLVLLSTLLPEKRPDRVYMLQSSRLEKLVGRVLALPNSRRVDLERWRQPGAGDLGDCIERVQRQGEIVTLVRAKDVSVEEIDSVLLAIASRSRFSSHSVKASQRTTAEPRKDPMSNLSVIFSRLQARESKWLTRLILKSYAPVFLPAGLVYRLYHHILPGLLKVQNELPAALHLFGSLGVDSSIPVAGDTHCNNLTVLKSLLPLVGVKVGRPPFFQARSIKNCVDIAQRRRMSIEKKYDGEYFQLHIEMSKAWGDRIKIFSKNGRDSTEDRVAVHSTIRQCLGLDEPNCKISTMCILEGELLVYSDKENKILDFHKIRKHVTRSGSFLGIHLDSQPHNYEHLMLMFFDILALDDEHVLGLKQQERRQLLERVIRCIPGRADLAEYKIVRFSSLGAATELRNTFAKCITARGEGLVMKPADEPYFNFENSRNRRSCYTKLKKEAFGTFGDVGDFAIVGATYDPVKAKSYKIPSLQWTEFYIGCIENKDDVLIANVKPRFVVVTTVSLNEQILKALVHSLHIISLPYGNSDHFDLRIANGINHGKRPSVIFTRPPVVDVRCFAFDKEGNTGFWTMRFPAVTKLHADRSFLDTISFVELQRMAEIQKQIPDDEAEEELKWIKLLEAADPRSIAVNASTQDTSPSTPTTPPSGQRLPEDSRHYQALLIREVPDRGTSNADTSPHTIDHISPSTSYGGTPIIGETRSSHLVSHSPSTAQNTGRSAKRTTGDRESPVEQLIKRPRFSNTAENSRKCFPAVDISLVTQSTSSHPLTHIANPSLRPRLSSKLGKVLSIQKKSGETNSSPSGESLGRKSDSTSGLTHPTQPKNQSPPQALRGFQGTGKFTLSQGPFDVLDARVVVPVATSSKGNTTCRQASTSCRFINCSFLLAPSVAKMPKLVDDLLPSHGAKFILDPNLWLNSSTCPRWCGFKIRKLVLVESRTARDTIQVFIAIKNLNMVGRDGKREWVEVYDFRIVECLSKMEEGAGASFDMWRHFWIGAA